MKTQAKLQKMLVYATSDLTDSLLGHACEDSVAEFLKYGCADAGHTVYIGCHSRRLIHNGLVGLQATIMEPATVHAVAPTAKKSMFIESTMFLK